MPISGRVKLFYEHAWGWLHGGIAGELAGTCGSSSTDRPMPLGADARPVVAVLAVGAGYGLLRLWIERRQVSWRPTSHGWFVIGWLAFVLAHFATYACMMPHFTEYGTWYFAPEFMTLWLLYGAGIVLFGRAIAAAVRFCAAAVGRSGLDWPPHGLLPAATSVALIAAGISPLLALPPLEGSRHPCVTAAQWLAAKLPAGQKIGCFSSGMVGYFAPAHQVINLDGLMNDRQYFEQYIRHGTDSRVLPPAENRLFVGLQSADGWRGNGFWGIDLGAMQLVRWWPMGGELSYGIWKALPDGRRRDVLDPCESGCDRISQIQFAADVLRRFEVVDEDALVPSGKCPSGRSDGAAPSGFSRRSSIRGPCG